MRISIERTANQSIMHQASGLRASDKVRDAWNAMAWPAKSTPTQCFHPDSYERNRRALPSVFGFYLVLVEYAKW